ncbi:MAG: hypothetical protein LQ346_003954 [Caloplaca aetnensis]|nr:MAG: hypothetical protein LQ346_003954 [Caloplaca aetnensis]
MCRAQRLTLRHHPVVRFSSTLDDNSGGRPKQTRTSDLGNGDWVAFNKSRLTTGLAQCSSVYRHPWPGRKANLGQIHPLALEKRQKATVRPETTPRSPQEATTPSLGASVAKRFRNRKKLSAELAKYIRSVAARSSSDSHESAVDNPTSTNTSASVSAPSAPSAHELSNKNKKYKKHSPSENGLFSKPFNVSQELASLKQLAYQQRKIVDPRSLTHLAFRGFGVQDLVAWHWVLMAKTAEDAVLRFGALANPPKPYAGDFGPVPTFVLLRLFERADISLRALKLLIDQVGQVLGSSDQPQVDSDPKNILRSTSTTDSFRSIGLDTLVVLVVRLLRHARRVWPASCVRISHLWVAHAKPGRVVKIAQQDGAMRLSFCYNQILSQLSMPPNRSPYQSLQHRERAQFMLIRQMNTFNPPLTIDRNGYRGVVQVQLAHRKTLSERRWASLKAKSWPPWKEDKLGVDASVGIEQGISRASDALRQMAVAGYGRSDWDKVAGILAGWDTDHSPTIQKRSALVPHFRPSSSPEEHKEDRKVPVADELWVARIQATRTLQEAWTCFLTCKDQMTSVSAPIYHAMFEKVVYGDERHQDHRRGDVNFPVQTEDEPPLAGDGKEVEESSTSHNQAVLTREPIPTFDGMSKMITSDHIRPSGRFLAFLLYHARTYDEGNQFLLASGLTNPVKEVLVPWEVAPVSDVTRLLETVPLWLFAAYVDFLCRFPDDETRLVSQPDSDHSGRGQIAADIPRSLPVLRHAMNLVLTRAPFHRPPWNSLLKMLARRETVVVQKETPLNIYAQAIPKFRRACRLLRHMDSVRLDMDFTGFRLLLLITANASVSAKHTLSTSDDSEERIMAHALLDDGLSLVKARFSQLVQPIDGIGADQVPADGPLITSAEPGQQPSSISTLSQIPHPAHLHAYIRFLGLYPDYDGLADLVRWMSTFSKQIMEEAQETANGVAMMRTCLVAARSYLGQRPPVGMYDDADIEKEAREHHFRRSNDVRHIIGTNEHWGEWLIDEEVEQYNKTSERPPTWHLR